MNILLVGYGKMGKMIEAAATERGHRVSASVDPVAPEASYQSLRPEAAAGADIAIEFSAPQAAFGNIRALVGLGLPVVAGTTGWFDELARARALVEAASGSLVYGANYSVGVNLFYRIVAEAARLMDGFPQYDVGGVEIHHAQKADSPSGTAKAIAEILLERIGRKKSLVTETLHDRGPAPEELHFSSLRAGSVPGTHAVIFDSTADTIELRHTARSREGFARGAVVAAEWLHSTGKKGLHRVEDIFKEL